jgi:hypothetical protein
MVFHPSSRVNNVPDIIKTSKTLAIRGLDVSTDSNIAVLIDSLH